MSSPWDDHWKVARLMQLWDEGLSTAAIGERLGVSKNAVCGKRRRLNLPERRSALQDLEGRPLVRVRGPGGASRLVPQAAAA
jgi:GcrA cell cycle regulator